MLTSGWRDQPKRLVPDDSPATLPKDQILATVKHTVAEWDKRTRELKKKKMLWKQQA